mgnify:CR=1 FL=1
MASYNGSTTSVYLSSVDMLLTREIREQLYKTYGNQLGQFSLDIEFLFGDKVEQVSGQRSYNWFEESKFNRVFSANGTVNIGGGAVTVTIPAAEHFNSGKGSYPIIGNTVEFTDKSQGVITAKSTAVDSAHTVTIKITTGAIATVTAADKIVVISNSWAEETGQPVGRTPTVAKKTNQMQLVKGTYQASGTAWALETEVQFEGEKRYIRQGQMEALAQFTMDSDTALLLQQEATGITDVDGKPLTFTRGLIPDIRTSGKKLAATGFSLARLNEMIAYLNNQKANKSYAGYFGDTLSLSISDFFIVGQKNDEVNYEDMGGKERAVKLGFNSIHKNGFSFFMKDLGIFNDDQNLGATGFGYRNSGVFVPTGDTAYMDNNRDKATGKSIAVRYLKDRYLEEWEDGAGTGRSGAKTGQVDTVYWLMRADRGIEVRGINRFLLLED